MERKGRILLFLSGLLVLVVGLFIYLLAHYHGERNHQGVGNRLLLPRDELRQRGAISTRERLGGILKHYFREAA